jgi:quercetin dioxygenase-like cupin family protein
MHAKLLSSSHCPNLPDRVVVQLPPSARVPSHHHAGFVFAYVLSGTVRSQLNVGPTVDYRMGQSWEEPPGTQHSLTANPSGTDSASLLTVFVASRGAKLTTIGP